MPTIVYHWWDDDGMLPIHSNLCHPIFLSIATIRANNPDVPITILDFSSSPDEEWNYTKDKFNVKIKKSDFFLRKRFSHITGYELLSRLFDVKRLIDGPIIYCDSDVFWIKNPLPLERDQNKFCFDGFNSGFYYYDPNSDIVEEMFETFESFTIAAMRDEKFCQQIKDLIKFDSWPYIWDETILTYMCAKNINWFNIVPPEEHCVIRKMSTMNETQRRNIKMFHCNGLTIQNPKAKREWKQKYSRGLACLVFEEIYKNLIKVLTEEDLAKIFTKQEMSVCLKNQMSLENEYLKIPLTSAGWVLETNKFPDNNWLI